MNKKAIRDANIVDIIAEKLTKRKGQIMDNRQIASKAREEMRNDILYRYDTVEYWNYGLLRSSIGDNLVNAGFDKEANDFGEITELIIKMVENLD